MADAFEMREHRHARFRLHARDQAFSAARHDDIDIAVEAGEHHADSGAVAGRDKLDRGFGQAGLAQALLNAACMARLVRRVGAAAQNGGVAGFQAERAGVGGHVGAALVNDADDAERHAYAFDAACRSGGSRFR